MIVLVYLLVGCANIQSTVDNGVEQIPGKSIKGSITVYEW